MEIFYYWRAIDFGKWLFKGNLFKMGIKYFIVNSRGKKCRLEFLLKIILKNTKNKFNYFRFNKM